MKIIIRPATEADTSFIMSSWLQSYRDTSTFAKNIPKQIYFTFHGKLVEQILERKSTTALIASPEEDPEFIYGYAVFEQSGDYKLFHYLYIKRSFGRFGLSKMLIEAAPFTIMEGTFATHMTHKGLRLSNNLGLVYCPYLI